MGAAAAAAAAVAALRLLSSAVSLRQFKNKLGNTSNDQTNAWRGCARRAAPATRSRCEIPARSPIVPWVMSARLARARAARSPSTFLLNGVRLVRERLAHSQRQSRKQSPARRDHGLPLERLPGAAQTAVDSDVLAQPICGRQRS